MNGQKHRVKQSQVQCPCSVQAPAQNSPLSPALGKEVRIASKLFISLTALRFYLWSYQYHLDMVFFITSYLGFMMLFRSGLIFFRNFGKFSGIISAYLYSAPLSLPCCLSHSGFTIPYILDFFTCPWCHSYSFVYFPPFCLSMIQCRCFLLTYPILFQLYLILI